MAKPKKTKPLALISGGTRGIGLEISRILAARGYDLSLAYLRQRKAARAAVEELTELGAQVFSLRANLGKTAEVKSWIDQTMEHFADRKINALILNAASGSLKSIDQADEQGWDWTYQINVRGAFFTLQAAHPHMTKGTTIVALSSLGSSNPIPDYAMIGSSKAALEAIVRQVAWEWGKEGIRINAVSGGAVATGALEYFPEKDKILAAANMHSCLPEPVSPVDIAQTVAWLCTAESRGIQGQTLVVDAGYSLSLPGV